MSHTDPIADMISRIKTGILAEKKQVAVPLSKVKLEIVKILKEEGYIANFKVESSKFPPHIVIELKYLGKKKNAIEEVQRVSKPGLRIYAGMGHLPKVLDGLGVTIVSTSQGIMTGKECRKRKVGGEILLSVW